MDFLNSLISGPSCVIQIRIPPSFLGTTPPSPHHFLPIFKGGSPIRGEVTLSPRSRSSLFHSGVKIELVGQIEPLFSSSFARSPSPNEFSSSLKELLPPGALERVRTETFEFIHNDHPYESYDGLNVRVRYFVRVTVTVPLGVNVVKEEDLWVVNFSPPPIVNPMSKTEVGISGFLHIEVHWAKEKFHLREIIFGKIYFSKVKLRIKTMEVLLIKKERLGSGLIDDENTKMEQVTVGRYEVMDGSPAKGETVPVRIFLAQHENLTPTYVNFNNQFSVEYCLSVVLIDEANRKYFRQQDIVLYRKGQE